jgi:hypothetical protein
MFNSREYEWSDVTVVLAGRDVTGIRGISYSPAQEKEALYAKGNKPHSIQRGNKSYSGSIRLLQSELLALQAAGGDVLDITTDIVVAYGNPSKGDVIHTDLVRGVSFTEVPQAINQNDKFMEIEIPFVALDIVNNYQ